MEKTINILIVDDSKLVRDILKDIFAQHSDLNVIGEAVNGREGVTMAARLKPDIITMDIQMPEMDGFEATEEIMAYSPTPILIFSSSLDKSEQYTSFKAISLGALDNICKPDITHECFDALAYDLVKKVRMLSNIKVIPHIRGKLKKKKNNRTTAADAAVVAEIPCIPSMEGSNAQAYKLVAIGASTGGPMALEKLLGALPADFPVGIVIVQHIAKGFIESFVEWMGSKLALKVKIARHRDPIVPGTVYMAPDDVQLEIDAENRILLRSELPPWGEFKPSVNHLFQSAANSLGERAIGIMLTGMGSDGAEGMLEMRQKGAYTIAQDRDTSLIYGMPKAAVDNRSVQTVLPLDRIPAEVCSKIEEK
ncbi:MAG: chemotaxis-specific protein-glutamate methyltransferase CheB [bacterium]|nr:chemotaxis-specific protein-glutamate methyltransferase CheB [bacterium]